MKAATMPRRPAYSRSTSYVHYQSNYRGGRNPSRFQTKTKSNRNGQLMVGLVLALVIGLGVVVGFRSGSSVSSIQKTGAAIGTPGGNKAAAVVPAPATNYCADNSLDKFIKISISKRHLWACEGTKMVFDAPVITGMENYDATRTPTGTYKIYGKMTDTRLTGQDETGSWNRPVSYWMPFLDNEHGTYGFHDANWRPESEFGNIDPNSDKGSHGCVELPTAAIKKLYDWAPTHTTLSVEP